MADRIYPQFQEESEEWNAEKQSIAVANWEFRHPEYDSNDLGQILTECAVLGIPATLYNMEVIMNVLAAEGKITASNRPELLAVVEAFGRECPEWENYCYGAIGKKNGKTLERWLEANGLSVTAGNLKKAFEACLAARTIRPSETGFVSTKAAIFIKDGITPEDRAKYANKPLESDAVRKQRLDDCRRAAIDSRYARQRA